MNEGKLKDRCLNVYTLTGLCHFTATLPHGGGGEEDNKGKLKDRCYTPQTELLHVMATHLHKGRGKQREIEGVVLSMC